MMSEEFDLMLKVHQNWTDEFPSHETNDEESELEEKKPFKFKFCCNSLNDENHSEVIDHDNTSIRSSLSTLNKLKYLTKGRYR